MGQDFAQAVRVLFTPFGQTVLPFDSFDDPVWLNAFALTQLLAKCCKNFQRIGQKSCGLSNRLLTDWRFQSEAALMKSGSFYVG